MTKTNDRTPIEAFLNRKRLDQGLEWKELADAAGISVAGLTSIRTGRTKPSELKGQALDVALGLPRGTVYEVAHGDPIPTDPGAKLRADLKRYVESKGADMSDAEIDKLIADNERRVEASRKKTDAPGSVRQSVDH